MEQDGMTNAELTALLETLAKLVEAQRKTRKMPHVSLEKHSLNKKIAAHPQQVATI